MTSEVKNGTSPVTNVASVSSLAPDSGSQTTGTELQFDHCSCDKIDAEFFMGGYCEDDSVLKAADSLIKDGFDVEYIPVLGNGIVSSTAVERALQANTGLVSVMYVNNETGAENPINDIGSLCLKHGTSIYGEEVLQHRMHQETTRKNRGIQQRGGS